MLRLFHNTMSSCAQKVRFTLAEKNLEWEGVELDLRAGQQFEPEFLRINPKGLVPALQHDEHLLVESNVIIEYLNEAFPEPPLLPVESAACARVRWWMKKLDDGLHLETIALSFGIAFRHQLIAACGSDEAVAAHFARIPDPYVREVQRGVVDEGIESPRFEQVVQAFDQLLGDLEQALSTNVWIVGDELTLADIAYAPYVTRLDHLHLQGLWDDRPNIARWYAALRERAGYQAGLTNWFNAKYLPLMDSAGEAAWPRLEQILSVVRAKQ